MNRKDLLKPHVKQVSLFDSAGIGSEAGIRRKPVQFQDFAETLPERIGSYPESETPVGGLKDLVRRQGSHLEVLDEDIGVARHPRQQSLPFGMVQVEGHALLVPVDAQEIGAVTSEERRPAA